MDEDLDRKIEFMMAHAKGALGRALGAVGRAEGSVSRADYAVGRAGASLRRKCGREDIPTEMAAEHADKSSELAMEQKKFRAELQKRKAKLERLLAEIAKKAAALEEESLGFEKRWEQATMKFGAWEDRCRAFEVGTSKAATTSQPEEDRHPTKRYSLER